MKVLLSITIAAEDIDEAIVLSGGAAAIEKLRISAITIAQKQRANMIFLRAVSALYITRLGKIGWSKGQVFLQVGLIIIFGCFSTQQNQTTRMQ